MIYNKEWSFPPIFMQIGDELPEGGDQNHRKLTHSTFGTMLSPILVLLTALNCAGSLTAFLENLVCAPFFFLKLGGWTAAAMVYCQWGLQQRWGSILVMHTCAHSN